MSPPLPCGGLTLAGPRLILRTDVLGQLLAAIAAVPAGQSLHIPALRDALINQGDVISGIETLIAANELDPATLRPPAGSAAAPEPPLPPLLPRRGADQSGAELFGRILAVAERRGLSRRQVSVEVFGNGTALYELQKPAPGPDRLAKIETWLAKAAEPAGGEEPPKPEPEGESTPPSAPIADPVGTATGSSATAQGRAHASPPESGDGEAKSAEQPGRCPPSPPAPAPSGAELADALAAYARQHGLALWRVSQHLFGGRSAVSRLRHGTPRQTTIDKVTAFLSGSPPAELAAQPAGGRRVADVDGVTGAALADQVDALIEKHGLSKSRVGLYLYGNRHGVEVLRHSNPRRATVEKVRGFLANPPVAALRSKAPLGDRRFAENKAERLQDAPTGAELAAELDAFIERTGVKVGRVSKLLFGCTGITQLRRVKRPKPETVEKVRLFIANPPEDLLAPRRSFNGATHARRRRDPTQKPDTPLMDLADRQRLNGHRHQAEIRRGRDAEAAALLDAGVDPGEVKSTYQANTMREIQRRRTDAARQSDPVEQAKLALRRRDRVVFDATVHGGRKGHFMVQGIRDDRTGKLKELTAAEIVALARRVDPGFQPPTSERSRG